MARRSSHRRKPSHDAPASSGPSRHNASHRSSATSDCIRCSSCKQLHNRLQFPKSALRRYTDRLTRGRDPESLKIICHACCNAPHQPQGGSNRPPQHDPGRGRCVRCHVEYPLTDRFFDKRNRHRFLDSHRICFSCKRDDILDAADPEADDRYAALDPDEPIMPYVLTDEEEQDHHVKFEDLADDAKQDRLAARKSLACIYTDPRNAFTMAHRRRLRRFLPAIDLVRQRDIESFLDLKASLPGMSAYDLAAREREGQSYFDLLTQDVTLDTELLDIARLLDELETTFLSLSVPTYHAPPSDSPLVRVTSAINKAPAPPQVYLPNGRLLEQDDADSAADSQLDQELERAADLLSLMRLSEHERIEQMQLRRDCDLLNRLNRDTFQRHQQEAESNSQRQSEELVQLLELQLELSQAPSPSEPVKPVPIFTGVLKMQHARRVSPVRPVTDSTASAQLASQVAGPSSKRPAIAAGPAIGASYASVAASPQPTKRPRPPRETPVDPRLAMFEQRALRARERQQQQEQQQQDAQTQARPKAEP